MQQHRTLLFRVKSFRQSLINEKEKFIFEASVYSYKLKNMKAELVGFVLVIKLVFNRKRLFQDELLRLLAISLRVIFGIV